MTKRIFTFLVAFLATLSGAVWGQDYPIAGSGDGSEGNPYILDLANPCDIGEVNWQNVGSVVDWHGDSGLTELSDLRYDAFQIQGSGYFKVINSAGPDAVSTFRIDIDNGDGIFGVSPALNVTLILENINIETENPKGGKAPIWIEDNGDNNDEHNVTIQLEGKNSLLFKQTQVDGAAIATNGNCDLTITGDGYLRAEGQVGIGMVEGISGDIRIEGGTVIAIGHDGPGFGGSRDNGTNLTIEGNTLVIAAGSQDIGEMNENLVKGIYYDSTSDYNNAMVHGDVTLDSQFPSSEELQEILGSDLKIDFDTQSNGKLTLGEGVYFNADKLANPETNKSKLTAYHVTYDNPSINNTTVSAAPAAIYCGPNTPLSETEMTASASTGTTYTFLGWTKTAEGTDKGTFVAASSSNTLTANNGVSEFPVEATFLLTQYSLDIVTGTKLAEGFGLVYPTTAKVTVADAASDPKLAAIGAKLSDDTKSVAQGDNVATIDEDDATKTVTLKATYTDASNTSQTKDVVLNLNVVDNRIDITDGALSFTGESGTKVYDAQAVDPTKLSWSITVIGQQSPITSGGGLTLKFKENQGDDEYMTSNPVNVSTYYAYVVAGDEPDATYQGTTAAATYTITKKEVTVASVASVTYDMNTNEDLPDYTATEIEFNGIIESEETSVLDTISWIGEADAEATLTPGVYENGVTYTISVADDNEAAKNYTIPTTAIGKLIVKMTGDDDDPINPGDPTDDNTEIKIEGGWKWNGTDGYVRVYDGDPHPLNAENTVFVRQKGGESDWVAVPKEAINVTYTYTEPEGTSETNPTAVENAGTYTASITIDADELGESGVLYSGKVKDITLTINARELDVNIKQITAEDISDSPITLDASRVTFSEAKDDEGIIADEEEYAKVTGTLTIKEKEGSATEGEKKYTLTLTGEDLVDNAPNFLKKNYTATFLYNGNVIPDEGVEITIPDLPAEDVKPSDGDEDGNDWTWSDANQRWESTYDGEEHPVTSVEVDGQTITPTDLQYFDNEGQEMQNPPVDAGSYSAEFVVKVGEESKTVTLQLYINPRPLGVNFDLSGLTEEYAGKTLKAADYANYIEVAGEAISGKVAGEEPAIDEDGTLKIDATPSANGKYGVELDGILFVENGDFKPSNYKLVPYINGVPVDNYNENTGEGSFGGDGDDEGGISFDDDNDDQGGITPGHPKYYNIYEDEICEGVTVEFSRDVVREGQSVLVTVKVDEEFDVTKLALQFKRSLFGTWKDLTLTPTENPNEYIIKNIYTDIYVRAEGAVPTGIESIDGAKVYAKDGSLFVQTPQLENVTIVTITGAIVKSEQQVGLKQYTGLQRGIYVVRVGEQVFKVRN